MLEDLLLLSWVRGIGLDDLEKRNTVKHLLVI